MPTNGLIVIAPVRGGMEEELRQHLNSFGNDITGVGPGKTMGEPRIEFSSSDSIHFARLAILDDPERGAGRQRLLFATDYDGSESGHLREVIGQTTHPDAIWGCCEGYDGPDTFSEFIETHKVSPGAYYIAFRGASLPRLQRCIQLNAWFQAWLANPEAEVVFRLLPRAMAIGAFLQKVGRVLWAPFDVVRRAFLAAVEVIGLMARLGVRNVIEAALCINATLNRVWWVHLLNLLFNNRLKPPEVLFSQADPNPPPHPVPPGYPPEDAILQNQLTLVTGVKPECLKRLRAVLALIDLYGRQLSTPGSLVGISTIHTVRWAIIDGGKRLLMVSNYDGTWENYIDEFAEMILSGLDALWTCAADFPLAGARDVPALKQFLRRNQVPANAFYSAYPATSVLNLKADLGFAKWYGWLVRRLAQGRKLRECPAPSAT